ncbi:unnamed protein product, partial [Mesorhabditis belari]|uniref:AB hydrolase-1 domain-containing protein n=1 Tax=Mesorhabditis belari TaxID=2138241 RepID=A0AAF3FEF2_9BILA
MRLVYLLVIPFIYALNRLLGLYSQFDTATEAVSVSEVGGWMLPTWAEAPFDGEWTPVEVLPPPQWVIVFLLLVSLIRLLHIFQSPRRPEVTFWEKGNKNRINDVILGIDMLKDPYRPPPLWGKSGHIQTAAYGVLGHANLRRTADRRVREILPDGSTVIFDVFEPTCAHPSGRDITFTLTPGIANSSESNYIRTLVHFAQEAGYRCIVLNHLGALRDEKLTGNRIFCYGGIEELTTMMNWAMHNYPNTKFLPIGFSMGGNLTTLYVLSVKNNPEKSSRLLMGLSVGQGYCALSSTPFYHDWSNGRRAYNYIITENMKRLLRAHYEEVVEPHVKSGTVEEQRLWSATSIVAFDEQYNRRIFGFGNLESFYSWVSCLPRLLSLTEPLPIPMIFLNAKDDPIVPEALWEPVKEMCSQREDLAFVLTSHGGHLGFLEGGSFSPKSVTWLDRFIVQMANSAVKAL